MGKVAKARKSTHATKKATAKTRGKIIEDPNAEWEFDSIGKNMRRYFSKTVHPPICWQIFVAMKNQQIGERPFYLSFKHFLSYYIGPVYLLFGKKKVRSAKGKTVKKYYVRKNEKHLIWVKWVQPFSDKKACVWSAEPQGNNKMKLIDWVLVW